MTAHTCQNPVPQRTDWATPPEVFDPLNAEFAFTLDVCANEHNFKVGRYFCPESDGLAQDWGENACWMNPPYGRQVVAWMKKAYESSLHGATVVALVPARVDAGWWHDYAMKAEVRFIRGRVRFVGAPWNAPFPCAVLVFRPSQAPKKMREHAPGCATWAPEEYYTCSCGVGHDA